MKWFKLFGIWIAILLVISLLQSSEIQASGILIVSCAVLVIIFYIRTRIHQQQKNQLRLQSEALAAVEILRTHLKPESPTNNLVDVVPKVNIETAAVMNSSLNSIEMALLHNSKWNELTPTPDAAMPWRPRAPLLGARVA